MKIFLDESKIADNVEEADPVDLLLLHRILYGADTTANWIRRKVQKFEKFDFEKCSSQFEVRCRIIEDADEDQLRKTHKLLEIPFAEDIDRRVQAVNIMSVLFRMTDPAGRMDDVGVQANAETLSLQQQPLEYGFSSPSVRDAGIARSRLNVQRPTDTQSESSSCSKISVKSMQVSILKAELDVKKRLAHLEEEQARQHFAREQELLRAELELKRAEAELMLQQEGEESHMLHISKVDATTRIEQWVKTAAKKTHEDEFSAMDSNMEKEVFESARSFAGCSNDHEELTKTVNFGKQPDGKAIDHSKRSDINREVLEMTKCMQKMLVRSSTGDGLPKFDGNIREWPLFLNQYKVTSEAGGYSEAENVMRLNKCLAGKARETVQHMLLMSQDGDAIMDVLERRFGRPEMLLRAILEEIKALPKVDNFEALLELDIAVRNLVAGVHCLKHHVYNPELLCLLIGKLPPYQVMMWGQFVEDRKVNEPTVIDFAEWLTKAAKCASSISYTMSAGGFRETQSNVNPVQYSGRSETRKLESRKCGVCQKEMHDAWNCDVFKNADPKKRFEMALSAKLCFCCLRSHGGRCERRQQCPIEGCLRFHHSLLHKGDVSSQLAQKPTQGPVANTLKTTADMVLLKILPVKVRGPLGETEVAALIDDGSTLTVLDASVAESLGIKGKEKPLCFQWTNNISRSDSASQELMLEISDVKSDSFIKLYGVRTVKNLNLAGQRAEPLSLLERYPYLQVADLRCLDGRKPLLLIGQQHVDVIRIVETYQPDQTSPTISKCKLGWAVHGPLYGGNDAELHKAIINICCEDATESLDAIVSRYICLEGMGAVLNKTDLQRSQEDRRATDIIEKSLQFRNGQYEVGLPYKSEPIFPESRVMAINRLKCTERKIRRNGISEEYGEKMMEYLEKGYAVAVSEEELAERRDKVWFLPHFPVQHPAKPNKIRIVFDAAAKSNGVSLNDALLTGPDLLKSIVGVLLRFRIGRIGFVADLREMFNRIRITYADSWSLCFLFRWDPKAEPKAFRMEAMIFGANSSPFIANYVKNRNADIYAEQYPEAANAIKNDHYVDDYLGSADSEMEAVKLISDVIKIHANGGFELRNFSCSSKAVLESIPKHLQSKTAATGICDGIERVLGLSWQNKTDSFKFIPKFKDCQAGFITGAVIPTKREVVSFVMSIFDPAGFVTPLTIRSRILIQLIWKSGIGWDALIDEDAQTKWKAWIKGLMKLEEVDLARCYSTALRLAKCVELHVFCDASSKAFAAVAYMRVKFDNEVDVSLVCSRARVAPLRTMTIPKLELQAALLGYRLAVMIKAELNIKFTRTVYWTDSVTVICWLRSKKALKSFVATRVGEICEQSEVSEWKWLPTGENVADEATRDTGTLDLTPQGRWFQGPAFLRKSELDWPDGSVPKTHDEHLEVVNEIMIVNPTLNVVREMDYLLPDPTRFSKWRRLIRATAHIEQARQKFMHQGHTICIGPTGEADAERKWAKTVQMKQFPDELCDLQAGMCLKPTSKLKQLSPSLDADGLIRVNGRIKRTEVDTAVRNPIILDSHDRYVYLLVQHYHEAANHQGRETVFNEVRQKYWIIGLRNLVRKVCFQCQYCRVMKPRQIQPEMGALPNCRTEVYKGPFTHSGMDFFGPFEVTVGRHREKRYGVIFTCMTSRAVHVELAYSLTTDSCILALRRMMSRRRQPDVIYSDNGTNLRGANRELRESMEQLSFADLEKDAENRGIEWKFNPPAASHFGGAWERLIRSVRTALREILKERAPKNEVLETLLVEAEHLVNSRPLTYVSSDANELEALTPNHLLIGCSSNVQTPGVFNDTDLNWGRQWRLTQALIDQFWKRFVKEFLPTLLVRPKWHTSINELNKGDVVFVTDMTNMRGKWPLGIITEVYPGADKVVRVAEVKTSSGIYRRPVNKLKKISMEGEDSAVSGIQHQGGECSGLTPLDETGATPPSNQK